jgi:hypothetical protein
MIIDNYSEGQVKTVVFPTFVTVNVSLSRRPVTISLCFTSFCIITISPSNVTLNMHHWRTKNL